MWYLISIEIYYLLCPYMCRSDELALSNESEVMTVAETALKDFSFFLAVVNYW